MTVAKDERPPSGEDTWPLPVSVKPYEASIATNTLSEAERQLLWRHLKAEHPAMANTLKVLVDSGDQDSAILNSLLEELDAGFVIPESMLPTALKRRLNE